MPEIQSLTLRVEELSRSVDHWNQLMIWGLAVAAIAAVFIVVATRIVVSRTGQLSTAQDLLREAKDRQLQLDLSQKGVEIGNLKVEADTAKTEMAKQQTRAAIAERSLLELQERMKIRHLSPSQRKKLTDFLRTPEAIAVPRGPIRVHRLFLDETAQPIASEIKDAFGESGWPSGDVGRDVIPSGGPIPVGIVLIFHDRNNVPAHAGVIQQALEAADLEPTLGENPGVPEGMVEIVIGIKP